MKSKQTKLVIIDGCGDELLDLVQTTVNYELSGSGLDNSGSVLVDTESLRNTEDDSGKVQKILEHLESADSATTSKHYEGLILLRR